MSVNHYFELKSVLIWVSFNYEHAPNLPKYFNLYQNIINNLSRKLFLWVKSD